MKKITIILFVAALLSSCFKEEDSRPLGEIKGSELIELGNNYDNQVFYSLVNNEIVSTNNYKIWHLGFYAQPNAFYITLNAACKMAAYKTNQTNWESVNSFNADWETRYDNSHGLANKMAIDFYEENISGSINYPDASIYVIDLGSDAEGNSLGGYKKLAIESIGDGEYNIKYSNLDGTEFHRFTIVKNASLNFVAFSFNNGGETIDVEPDKSTWDLLFTRYSDTVFTTDGSEYIIGYAVTGAYLNPAGVEAYLNESVAYEDVDLISVDQSKFSSNYNTIGHDWKDFQGTYTIYENKVYLVKTQSDLIFKLRFLNFYDPETGLKGYPEFEYELL